MRRVISFLTVAAMLLVGCASAPVRQARDQAEIERLRLHNEDLQRRIRQGIVVRGATFEADLPVWVDERLAREALSKEAAEADILRLKGQLILQSSRQSLVNKTGASREETRIHFWYDEWGREWLRGYWHNLSQYTLVGIKVNGMEREAGIPLSLKPGAVIDNLWALAGTRIYLTAIKKDGQGKERGRVDFSMNLRSAGLDPHDVVNGKAYQWKVVTRY